MSDEDFKCVCIACRKQMKNYMSDGLQPDGGIAFYSKGHYGSTIFDPMDGSYLEIVVCDECVSKAAAEGLVFHAEMMQLAKYKTERWDGKDHGWEAAETEAVAPIASDRWTITSRRKLSERISWAWALLFRWPRVQR